MKAVTSCGCGATTTGRRSPAEGWVAFGSTTVPGTIHLAATGAQGPWFLALDHPGIIEELDLPVIRTSGPGLARYAFDTLGGLYGVLPRIYQLAGSLPDAPLREFQAKVRDVPKTTEAERLVVQRIGQDIFRDRLMDYWRRRCPLTGIAESALLRASHHPMARLLVPEADIARADVPKWLRHRCAALWRSRQTNIRQSLDPVRKKASSFA